MHERCMRILFVHSWLKMQSKSIFMKSIFVLLSFIFVMTNQSNAQNQGASLAKKDGELPYRQIPDYPKSYTPENVAARMIDGLGYRYFWATESLREEDLVYKPSEDSRTTGETVDHIHGLSRMILKRLQKNDISSEENLTFDEKRKQTLVNIQKASLILKGEDSENDGIIFQSEDDAAGYPFWNMINGPIADAIYHTGQVVAYRRASGNPIHPGVSVFSGKTKE